MTGPGRGAANSGFGGCRGRQRGGRSQLKPGAHEAGARDSLEVAPGRRPRERGKNPLGAKVPRDWGLEEAVALTGGGRRDDMPAGVLDTIGAGSRR